MKFNRKFKLDWRLILFFALLLALPFIVFANASAACPNMHAPKLLPADDTIPEFVVVSYPDTLHENAPAVYSSITIALDSIPADTVLVIATPDAQLNLGLGAGVPITLYFRPYPVALTPQEIKVKPVDDAIFEGLHQGNITFYIDATGSGFNDLVLPDLQYVIEDNDLLPGINSVINVDTFLTEGLTGVDLLFALNSIPTDTVIITVDPDDQLRITGIAGEAVQLVFPPNGTCLSYAGVSVRANNDIIYEGTHSGTLNFTIETSDVIYSDFIIDDVTYTIIDNDSIPAVHLDIIPALELTEGIGDIPVNIYLSTVPSDTVFINVIPDLQLRISGAPGEAVQLVFAPNASALNYHPAVVKAYDDAIFEGEHSGNLSFEIITNDVDFAALNIEDITILIHDNDLLPGIIISDTTALAGVEGDSLLFFNVVLTSIPSSTVTMHFDPDDQLNLGKGHGTTVDVKFKEDSALIARQVNVYIYDDPFSEGNHIGIIATTITTSDIIYGAYSIPDIIVSITDNDAVSIVDFNPKYFNIYPNISRGEVMMNISTGPALVSIFDIGGQRVKTLQLQSGIIAVDLSELNSGSYIATIDCGLKKYYCKLIITH